MTQSDEGLARDLGLRDIVMFGVGGIIGAGIYAIIGEAAGYGGNLLWLSFLIAATVAFLTAATYAELVSRFPDAGGSFEYVKQAFGIRLAAVASIAMLFTGVVAAAAIAISFSSYLSRLFSVPVTYTTVGVIVAMGIVNAVGAAQASWFNTLATLVTLAGLGAVVAVTIPEIGSTDLLGGEDTSVLALGVGGALIFFSYIGFEDLVKLAEETQEPERTMPKGIMISAVIVLAVYLLVAVGAVSAMGGDELAAAEGPLAQIMEARAGPIWATGIVIVALFATSKTILSNLLGTSRLSFDVARDSGVSWLEPVGRVNDVTRTPLIAAVLVAAVAVAFGLIGDLQVVASIANILIMLVFLTVNAALLAIRRTSDENPAFSIPGAIGPYPISVMLSILGVLALLVLNLMALIDAV